ncbi:MAG: hypothetical protein HDT18_09170 [Oscillibacter sp.]|nr:hypothetical protein [Oscillibacter sp.]
MMKLDTILSFVLSVLEGGLAGACFYRAGQEKEKKRKVIWHIVSAAWFVLSVLDGTEGMKALEENRAAADEALDWEE